MRKAPGKHRWHQLGLFALASVIRSPILGPGAGAWLEWPARHIERDTRALEALSGCTDDTNRGYDCQPLDAPALPELTPFSAESVQNGGTRARTFASF
jgi:hypothetical protein